MENLFKKRSILKEKLRGRKKVFGAWTSLAHPSVTEIFSRTGVDFIGIDVEHSTIDQEQSQRIIAAAQGNNTLCLPRIASHNPEMIRRLLDSGADGIIMPTVSTPEEAEEFIQWAKYPPRGHRGFGISRGQGYGFDFHEYTKQWNETSSLIVQIESIKGVENLEKILTCEEIDAVMVGPYDLSGSLGIPGEINHPLVTEACEKIIRVCEKYDKGCGTQLIEPSKENVLEAFSKGYTMVVLASDIFLLWKWAERMKHIVPSFA